MRILFLEVDGFRWFKVSRISKLIMSLTSNIQVILGPNGSGKSSLLRELLPDPPPGKYYPSGGKKKLVIEHRGHTYELISDYGSKDHPHSFIMDGDQDLNESGTKGVQEELLRTHLGYHPWVRDIIDMSSRVTQMGEAARSEWLTHINPYNTKHIHTKHKAVQSKIRAIKNVLSRLYERKAHLEAKLLPEHVFLSLKEESAEKQKILSTLTRLSIVTEDRLETLKANKSAHPELSDERIGSILRSLGAIKKKSLSWGRIPSEMNAQEYLSNLKEGLAKVVSTQEGLRGQIDRSRKKINELERDLSEANEILSIGDGLEEIGSVQKALTSLEKKSSPDPIPFKDLESVRAEIPALKNVLDWFIGNPVKLVDPSIFVQKELTLKSEILPEERALKDTLRRLHGEVEELETRRPQDEDTQVNPEAICETCPLYLAVSRNLKAFLDRMGSLHEQIEKATRRLELVEKESVGLKAWLDDQAPCQTFYKEALRLLKGVQYQGDDVIETLNTDPNRILIKVNNRLSGSLAFYERSDLEKSLNELLRKQELLDSVTTSKIDMTKSLLTEERKTYEGLVEEVSKQDVYKKILEKNISWVEEYIKGTQWLTGFEEQFEASWQSSMDSYGIEVLTMMLKVTSEEIQKTVNRLGSIDATLKEQEDLKSRYGFEVIDEIAKEEALKEKYLLLEKALSPSGIPQELTVSFINSVIEVTNVLLDVTFEKLHLEKVALGDKLSFEFKAIASGVRVEKLSDCSEGQRDGIDLCWNLALMVVLGLTDYPVTLDETGRTFDHSRAKRLVNLIHVLLENQYVSQVFITNHNVALQEGLVNSEITVLSPEGIIVPEIHNQHVIMEWGE